MRNAISRLALLLLTALLSAAPERSAPAQTPPPAQSPSKPAATEEWPREITNGEQVFTVYQPALESWDGTSLEALAAISVKRAKSDSQTYGVAWIAARTEVDKSSRMVRLEDIRVPKVIFPSAHESEKVFLDALRKTVLPKTRTIALDRLEAALTIHEAGKRIEALPLKNDPPRFIFSTVPAILVYVDGNPVYKPVKGAGLERVINTRPLLLKDSSGKHYLHVFDGWMEASQFGGPWTVCKKPQGDLEKAVQDAVASGQVDLLEGRSDEKKDDQEKADQKTTEPKPSLSKPPVPAIYVATSATELLVTDGEPKYVSIKDTALLFAENTTGHIFKHSTEQKSYVVVSGRWFRSASLQGPWEFVPGGKLPPDFAKIPDDSPKENVKASVPDTPQALEAVIANSIPQTATVKRSEAKLNQPQFDGEPQFKPIDGTPLHYAVNTATPLIQAVSKVFYAVENGVWFSASSVKGPWAVAISVPTAIYSIPPSSPLHFVTYVKINRVTATEVNVGYTPGYYGTVVTRGSGFVVAFGTGYPYSPWVGGAWFPPPMTYGCGVAMTYTPWTGWTYGYGFGATTVAWGWGAYPWWGPVGWGYYYPYPYYRPPYYYGGAAWGPRGAAVWGPGGWAATSGNVYSRWGSGAAVTRHSGGFNAWTGNSWARDVGMSYNSRTGNLSAGHRASVGNVYTGNYAAGSRGAVTSTRTGNTVTGGRVTAGNIYSGQSGSAGYLSGDRGTVARVGDDVYAGKDGNVYRRNENGWQQHSGAGSGWQSVDPQRPAGNQARPQPNQSQMERMQSLEMERNARELGQQRTGNYRSGAYRSAGGGARGGGGRRR